MTAIILASASPRRRELLQRIGISIEVQAADIDESLLEGEAAVPYALRVAAAKADRIARNQVNRLVIAADTVVEVDTIPMGKASSLDEARSMLTSLRGREHRVTTAVAIQREGEQPIQKTLAVTTVVVMRDFSDTELEDYLQAEEYKGKAGAYAVQGMAAAFVTEVQGSVTNVIGLPLAEVVGLLAECGISPSFQDGVAS